MNTRFMGFAALLGLTALACQPAAQEAATAALTDADIAAIESLPAQWAEHAKMGHASVVADLYTEDAMELPPNEPMHRGRAAIMERLESDFAGLEDITITADETEGAAGIAYTRGTYSATFMEEGMEEPFTDTGKWIGISHQQADGSWLLSRLIWNSDQPLPEMGESGMGEM